jgi:hypothetical protein
MMSGVPAAFAFPFRFERSGAVALVDSYSDAGQAQHLGLVILTRRGERDLAPAFGIPDPRFDKLDRAPINACTALFGPPVTVTDLDVTITSPTRQAVTLTYEPRGAVDA